MILVTGATGKVGREAVRLLLEGGEEVEAVTRDPASAAASLPAGARVVGGNPAQPQTLAPALTGVEALFLNPLTVGDAAAELLWLAADAGVQRVVVLSALTVQYPVGYAGFADAFRAVEFAARTSGLQWTFLRCADFDANALAWAPQIRAAGAVYGVYSEAATSPIHEDDIAAVGARTLVDAEHAGHAYVLTGPESLTQPDKVQILGEAIGRELSWVEVTPDQLRESMLAQGVRTDVPERLIGSLADYAKQPGPTSTEVEELLGRPARTFAQWAAGHADAFRNGHRMDESRGNQ
jgi:uncharacterized protein YbjT (DUF2867 family)